MSQETIRLEHLDIGYRDKKSVKTVATDINAAIRQGELTCLLGANGVGKSTLLRTLSAFQPKLGGSIFIGERELSDYSDRELSRLIGVVLTEKPSVQNMTVRELVGLGRSPYTDFWGRMTDDDHRIVSDSLAQVGISHLAERLVDTVSDGEPYFHVNWGWSGSSNGYFKLTLMNPNSHGTGASSTDDGYTNDQRVIAGLQPAKASLDDYGLCLVGIEWNKTQEDVPHQIGVLNTAGHPATFLVAFAERQADGTADLSHLYG